MLGKEIKKRYVFSSHSDLPYTQEYQTMRPQFKAAMEKKVKL